jgi:hypothetical protein
MYSYMVHLELCELHLYMIYIDHLQVLASCIPDIYSMTMHSLGNVYTVSHGLAYTTTLKPCLTLLTLNREKCLALSIIDSVGPLRVDYFPIPADVILALIPTPVLP